MKNLISTIKWITPVFLTGIGFIVNAQKLPNIQSASVYAPAAIKIDGKADEWNNTYQAYNHATEISYTLSNDADHLYLAFQATDKDVIQKIMDGGITLTISSVDKKSTISPVSVTYPVVPFMNSGGVNYKLRFDVLTDSAVRVVNKQISGGLKEIKISGIKEIPEPSVSVYNDLGIVGAQYIDNKKVYTCELALPVKFIKPVINDKGAFKYNIQVNGIDLKTTKIVTGSGSASAEPPPPSDGSIPHGMQYEVSPTYFSAEYTLAKK